MEDLDGIRIRPVVQHGPEDIDIGAPDHLLGEEVVRLILDATSKIRRSRPFFVVLNDFGQILYDRLLDTGKLSQESFTQGATGPAYIDNYVPSDIHETRLHGLDPQSG